MMYVVDTHPLFWSLFAPHHLSPRARSIFEQTGNGISTMYIPAIVVTELLLVVERRCTSAQHAEFLEALHALRTAGNYLFLPLMPETVISSYALTDIADIFDRLVVAEARRLRVPLITCDTAIIASGLVDVAWE
jgi:PIN domain nuclease of toxin-antitoxin system